MKSRQRLDVIGAQTISAISFSWSKASSVSLGGGATTPETGEITPRISNSVQFLMWLGKQESELPVLILSMI